MCRKAHSPILNQYHKTKTFMKDLGNKNDKRNARADSSSNKQGVRAMTDVEHKQTIDIQSLSDLAEFKKCYRNAVEQSAKQFSYRNQLYYTPFAKYVIEYYDTLLEGSENND